MAARPLVAFFLLLVLCFLPGIDATHFAYATMRWNLTNTRTFTVTANTAVIYQQDYTYTMEAAFRWSFFGNPSINGYANTGANVYFVPMGNPPPTCAQVGSCKSFSVNLLVVQTNPPDDWFYGYVNGAPALQYTNAVKTKYQTSGPPNYRIYYTNCCRLSSIRNSNNDLDWTITAILNTKVGRSPITTGTPRVWLALNVPSVYFIPYVSQANLPVYFYLSAKVDSTLNQPYPNPQSDYGPFTFNNVIGRVDWTPARTGLYAIQFMIEEVCGAAYPSQTQCRLNGNPTDNGGSSGTGSNINQPENCCARIPLDFIFQIVVQCTSQITTNCFNPPYFYSPFDPKVDTDPSKWVITFYRNIQGTFLLCATHDDPTQLVEISLPPLPPRSVMNGVKLNSANRGRPACYEFVWTPTINDVDHNLCFYATAFPSQAKSIGQYCILLKIIDAPGFVITGIIRDFHYYHPNFNRTAADWYTNSSFPNNAQMNRPNWVKRKLGSDYKPEWNPAASPQPRTVFNSGFGMANTSEGWYDWWHTDPATTNPRNLQTILSFTLTTGVDPNPFIGVYVNNFFFPIDNRLFGNEGADHNYFYTYEVNTYMTYHTGLDFYFTMDDDFWFFVDMVLPDMPSNPWNLHGIRPAIAGKPSGTTYHLDMDAFVTWAVNAIPGETHDIQDGETVRCDFFYAHRRNDLSPTFTISLPNFTLCDGLSSGVEIFNWPHFGDNQFAGQPKPSSSLVFYPSKGTGAGATIAQCNGTNQCLQLSQTGRTNSISSVWYTSRDASQGPVNPTPLLLTHGFRLEGSFQINGAQTGSGAEGFAVVMVAASGSPASGAGSGFNLGYGNALAKSLAVEFDFQQSSAANDPVGYNASWWGQVSVHTRFTKNANGDYDLNSAVENVGAIPTAFGGTSDPTLPLNFKNGTAHYFKIEYQPAKFDPSNTNLRGVIRVWVGRLLAPVVEAFVDQNAFNEMIGGAAYLGFTTGSGDGSANLFISQARLLVVPTSAAQTTAIAPPFSIIAGDTGYVTIQAKDACGDLILTGGELASFSAMYQRVKCTTPFVNATGVDNNNGSYTFYYNPTVADTYTFPITFNGQPILNSPFTFTVDPAPVDPASSFAIFSQPPNAYSNVRAPDGMACARYTSLGAYLDFKEFDLDATGDIYGTGKGAALAAWIGAVSATDYVACALSGDKLATPQRNTVAAAITAKWAGANKFGTLTAGNSYALVARGAQVSEVTNTNRVSIAQLSGIDASSVSFTRSFNVTAESATSFCGPYARVKAVFNDTRVPAATANQLGIEGHDRFGNLNPANVFTAYFSPDITVQNGTLEYNTGLSGGGYHIFDYENPKAGQYFFYVKVGGVNVKGSQYLVTFTPGLANWTTSIVSPDAAVETAGVDASFIVSLNDKNYNPINFQNPMDVISAVVKLNGAVLYTVTLTWTDGSVGGVPCTKCILVGSYSPTLATTNATMEFTINGVTGVKTPVTINPGPLSPPHSNCTFQAASLPPAGLSTSLIIQAKDRFSNLRLIPNQPGDVFNISYNPAVQTSTSTIGAVSLYLGIGQYQASFTPIQKGNQSVIVRVVASGAGDVTAGDHLVCQTSIPVIPGAPYKTSEVTIGFTSMTAGQAQTFTLLSKDPFNNTRDSSVASTPVAQATDYLYRFYSPTDPRRPEGTSTVSLNAATGIFSVSLNATVAATYLLEISTNPETKFALAYPSTPLNQSPITIVVRPGPTYPRHTVFTSATGSYGGFPGNQSSFRITANDIFNNTQIDWSDRTRFNVTVYNTNGTIFNQPTLVDLTNAGNFNVTYTNPPNPEGQVKQFTIRVCHPGVPYADWCTDLIGTVLPDTTVSYAEITTLPGQAGFVSNWTIDNKDNNGNPVQITTSFTVVLTRINPADNVQISPITVTCRVPLQPDGSCPIQQSSGKVYFDAVFTPTVYIGEFRVRVFAYGVVETEQSKTGTLTAIIGPGVVSPPNSKVFDLPATIEAGTPAIFHALLADAWNHNITAPKTVMANATSPDGQTVLSFTGAQIGDLYQFNTATQLQKAGVWTVRVFETESYANKTQYLAVSSFRLTVTPGPADPETSYVVLPVISSDGALTTAGQAVTLVVYPLDEYGNSVTDLTTSLTFDDPLNQNATTWSSAISVDGNGVVTFKVLYTPYKIAMRPNNNSITVSLPNGAIVGTGPGNIGSPSPISVMINPAAVSATLSTVSAPNRVVQAGSSLAFQVTVYDIYGNLWYSNRPEAILASVAGGGSSAAGATASSQGNSSYIVEVDGSLGATTKASQWTGSAYAADYIWTVTADLVTLTVPAFTVENGPAAGAQSVHQDLTPIRVGRPREYSIVTYDEYGNRCYLRSGGDAFDFVFLVGTIDCGENENETTPVDESSDFTFGTPVYVADGQYNYNVTGQVVGKYTLNFTTNGTPLECIQKLVQVVQPGFPCPPNSTWNIDQTSIVAGTTIRIDVQVNDCFKNPVGVGGTPIAIGNSVGGTTIPWASIDYTTNRGQGFDIPNITNALTLTNVQLQGRHHLFAYASPPPPSAVLRDYGTSFYTFSITPYATGDYAVIVSFQNETSNWASVPPNATNWVPQTNTNLHVVAGPPRQFGPYQPPVFTPSITAGIPTSFSLSVSDFYGNRNYTNYHTYKVAFTALSAGQGYVVPVTIQNGTDGTNVFDLVSAWHGLFALKITMSPNDGSADIVGDTVLLNISHATCAYDHPDKPYRCPDQSCVAAYSECAGLDAADRACTSGVYCKLPSGTLGCAPNIQSCACDSGLTMCTDGHCASDCPPFQEACPPGYQACMVNGKATGACRKNLADCPSVGTCPPGLVVCPNGLSCADTLANCPVMPTCSSGAQCANGLCVSSLADCPTQPSCGPGKVLCLTDFSCQTDRTKCPQQYECYAPTAYRCPGGACRNSSDQCPSLTTCPLNWVKCEGTRCAESLASCPDITNQTCPLNQTRCPLDGACTNNLLFCASKQTCPPSRPIQCFDGSCASSVLNCPQATTQAAQCGSYVGVSLVNCPDGSCAASVAQCPTGATCPAATPVLCGDGSCQTESSLCPVLPDCPPNAPVRCSDGLSCRGSLPDCPTIVACSPGSIKCSDGTCALALDTCVPAASCPNGTVRCTGGECVIAYALCPTHVTCPIGYSKCSDGTCQTVCPYRASVCSANQVVCPQASAGVQCESSIEQCPPSFVCPSSTPIRCADSSCAVTVANCPSNLQPPPADKFPCADGTWASSLASCPTPVTCPTTSPYKCWDNTCRKNADDCPIAQPCADGKFLCSNGACVDPPWDTACIVSSSKCPDATPYQCLNGTCVTSSTGCDASDPLATGGSPCPKGFTQCQQGNCVKTASAATDCVVSTCPQSLPVKCDSGLCVADVAQCPRTNGCPATKPELCTYTGACMTAAEIASGKCVVPPACPRTDVPADYTVTCTSDGSCAPSLAACPLANGCPSDKPIRCLDKTCAASDATATATNPTCNDPISPRNRCPTTTPYHCPDGFCATSFTSCPYQTAPSQCGGATPFSCADGSCVSSSVQCPLVVPCNSTIVNGHPAEQRCGDGTCRPYGTCTVVNLCAPGVRCDSGLCAPSQSYCNLNYTTGCLGTEFKCPSGECAIDEASCSALPTANGCPATAPVKCFDGSCKASAADCNFANGCPTGNAIRCNTDGSCRATVADCNGLPQCTKTICADGSCNDAANCTSFNGCPVATPVRCADGTCAKYEAGVGPKTESCPLTVVCNSGEYLCADGKCRATPSLCTAVAPCPSGTVRCGFACAADCNSVEASRCPSGTPVLCKNGACVASSAQCTSPTGGPKNQQCATSDRTTIQCADGSCGTAASCIKKSNDVKSNEPISQETSEANSGCPTGFAMCSNGLCVNATEYWRCPIIARCAPGQYRCDDGSCAATCGPKLRACSAGTRCEDGWCRSLCVSRYNNQECRSTCLPYDGCGLKYPYHCSNRECAASPAGCVSAAQKPQQFYRRLLQNTNVVVSSLTPCTKSDCLATLKASQADIAVDITANTNVNIVFNSGLTPVLTLGISSGTFVLKSNTSTTTTLSIRAVAESDMRYAINEVHATRRFAYGSFLPFSSTVLSPAFSCVTGPDVESSNVPIVVTAWIDLDIFGASLSKRPTDEQYGDVCLAYLYELPGFKAWRCVVENATDRAQGGLSFAHPPDLVSYQYVRGSIDSCRPVTQDGIQQLGEGVPYAFILAPRLNNPQEPEGLDVVQRNIVWIILGVLLGIAALVLLAYCAFRLFRYRGKYHKERDEADRLQEEVDNMKQFGGEAGNKDDAVAMTSNPLSVQLKDVQKQYDAEELKLKQAENELRKQEGEIRQEHIAGMRDNRDKLAEELERLKKQLAEQQAASGPKATFNEDDTSAEPMTDAPVREEFSAPTTSKPKRKNI